MGRRSSGRGVRRRAGVAMVLAGAVAVLGGCTQDDGWSGAPRQAMPAPAARLVAATGCDALVRATRAQLRPMVTGAGMGDDLATTVLPMQDQRNAPADAAPFAAAAGAPAEGAVRAEGSAAGTVVAGTNNQEAGVDEGDLVKTDGRRIVTVVDGVLRVTVLDDDPAVDGRVDLRSRSASQLFLRGDEALVLGGGGAMVALDDVGPVGEPPAVRVMPAAPGTATIEPASPATTIDPDGTTTTAPSTTATTVEPTTTTTTTTTTVEPTTTTEPPAPTTTLAPPRLSPSVTLTRVDLSDPTAPAVVETTEVEGSLAAARLVDGAVRVVVRSTPAVVQRMWSSSDPAAAVAELGADDVVPRRVDGGRTRPLVACHDVLTTPVASPTGGAGVAPGEPAPTTPEQVTVLTVRDGLADLAPVTVQGSAGTVYASTRRLYVAGQGWGADGPMTAVHRFDLTTDGAARYTGSGLVPGTLLDQYSLSERGDDLRLVTTTESTGADVPVTGGPAVDVMPVPATAGRLAVLRADDGGVLGEVGHVDDLGVGERVQSVRFLDDLAYVVTFRQTDPLFALDLSDPTAPRVLGELKIPGFSEYLHPLGDGLLLGVGRDAEATTGRQLGFKVSLFDVSDPAAPRELDTFVRPDTWSPVSDDALAFGWDPLRRQAVVPVTTSCTSPEGCAAGVDESALVLGVDGGRLVLRGQLRHTAADDAAGWPDPAIVRSVVVDDDLWTVSAAALGRTPAGDPTSVALVPYR